MILVLNRSQKRAKKKKVQRGSKIGVRNITPSRVSSVELKEKLCRRTKCSERGEKFSHSSYGENWLLISF